MAFVHAPAYLVGLALLSTIVEAPFLAASQAAIPNLVGEEDLTWANSLISIGRNLGITVGPALGGVLLGALGASWVFGLNAISFVFSALLVWTVRAPFAERRDPGELVSKASRGVRAGFRFLFHEPVLRRLAIGAIVFVLGLAMVLVADAPRGAALRRGIGRPRRAHRVLGRRVGARLVPEPPAQGASGATGRRVGAARDGSHPDRRGVLAVVLADPSDGVPERGRRRDHPGCRAGHPATPHARRAARARVSSASDAGWQTAQMISFVLAGSALNLVGPQGLYVVGGVAALLASLVVFPIVRVPAVVGSADEAGGGG